MFCLPVKQVNAFLEKLKSGEIDPARLSEMTSAERRSFFKDIVGDVNAKQVNALFESKLLLKNQQQGFINWAKQVTGLSEPAKRDILSRVERMTEVLQPKELDSFLEDLAAKKLGVGVTFEEAGKITSLAQEVAVAKEKMAEDFTFPSFEDRMDYGRKLVDFKNYVNDVKLEAKRQTFQDFKNAPGKFLKNQISDLGGLAKSLKATLDNSVIGRQGLKVLFSNPMVWLKNTAQSFVDIVRTFGGAEVIKEVEAEVLSRPNALNGLYQKEKLAVGNLEEAYPTRFPEKIPLLGRIFKASEAAFTAFQYRTRADVFDKYVDIANLTGADITGIGRVANALTGRGNLGALEPSANTINNLFFSPRFMKSNIDLLTAHAFDSNIGPFARKQAAMNLAKVVIGISGVLTIANAVRPGSVDVDPRSANFGKIRIGDTRFDVSGGISSLITLASRIGTFSTKSPTTGNVTKLNSGKFGSQTVQDVVKSFFEGKLAPVPSVINDLLRGHDYQGNKPSIAGEAKNLLVPLPITTGIELWKNPNAANPVLSLIADGLGIGTNTYSLEKNWNQNPGVELQAFKEKIGQKRFDEANALYNKQYSEWLASVQKLASYKKLSDDDKLKVQTKKKDTIKTAIFKRYGFTYKKKATKQLPKL